MAQVNLGPHFERFVQEQIEGGRFRDPSDVIKAGLQLLEDHELSLEQRRQKLKDEIAVAFNDPSPGRPADEVFDALEARFEADIRAKAARHGA
jgi:antitoxin ParD1/3/4